MKPLMRSAAAALLLTAAPVAVMADDSMSEAEKMMEQAEAMRMEADALARKAQTMMDEAKAAMTAKAEAAEAETPEPAEQADAGSEGGDSGGLNVAVAYEEDGKYFNSDDIPTYNIADDGTIDWYTFSGFRRYHAECHVCHGPDGEGSTYAPALKDSAVNMDYYDFVDVIVNGRKKIGASENSVMPAFGTNNNVMCYVDDIYVYLKARGTDAVARGRPPKKERKSDAYRENEDACMG
jgi:methanol metabolism-related c-type cytochrome